MTLPPSKSAANRLVRASRLWLLLDYDGTLADFAPTPDHVIADPHLIDLLTRVTEQPNIRAGVISGRRLGHIETLVPVPGMWLAGTYGIEIRTPDNERIHRVSFESIRPALDKLKPLWAELIAGQAGFYLEDKGWALALHARFAEEQEAEKILQTGRRVASQVMSSTQPDLFRLLGGHKFLEIGPRLANKGLAVDFLLDRFAWPGATPVFMGDDDKDEEAFGAVQARGGIAIVVSRDPRQTLATERLVSPKDVREVLAALVDTPAGDRSTTV
jgi:trehalose 6-phosphate phosphatase